MPWLLVSGNPCRNEVLNEVFEVLDEAANAEKNAAARLIDKM